jgi:hypothetical protein
MDEREQPMDDDEGEWAYQLELEQQYFEEVNNYGSESKKTRND